MIRAAAPGDAAAIARVHVRSWRRAYSDRIESRSLVEVTVEERESDWRSMIADPAHGVWVYELEGRIAGFTSVRGDELVTLYVDPPAQGAGVGSALIAQAEAAGARRLVVFADNGLARAFYERHGWRDAGPGDLCQGLPSAVYRRGGP